MPKSIISEGKTTSEAIESGLKQLRARKEAVEIRILEEEDKRSFFSILSPRVVKVELTLKENNRKEKEETIKKENENTKKIIENIKTYMEQLIKVLPSKNASYSILVENYSIRIIITGEDINYLIGYRGETLNALQTLISTAVNKGVNEKIRILLDVEGYRKKREKTLEELADKLSKTVMKTGKAITLEPMTSYERKIIHSRLQSNKKVKTESIGEEPYRKVIISLK